MSEEFVFSKLSDMTVSMQTQKERNMSLLRGKAVLNEEDKRFTFIQNKPRGPRSVEVGRTRHSRIVRRPDGMYTLTLRFGADEKYLKESLISELRNVVDMAKKDLETEGRKSKQTPKNK